jgi:hypothetical protein
MIAGLKLKLSLRGFSEGFGAVGGSISGFI